jgi:hypothetical protein
MTDFELNSVERYLKYFWRDCPAEALELLRRHVVPAALNDPSSYATDLILRNAPHWGWYGEQQKSTQQRFHKLVGHCVRASRGFVVVRTADGRPMTRPSPLGPHASFTVQRRRGG